MPTAEEIAKSLRAYAQQLIEVADILHPIDKRVRRERQPQEDKISPDEMEDIAIQAMEKAQVELTKVRSPPPPTREELFREG